MRVHLYTLCWNEADMLGFFFHHYDQWVDRYVVFDDGSTDDSLGILRGHPKVEVRSFERTHEDSFVLSQQELQNEVWKESRSRADWVIITALDEHLQANKWNNGDYLAACARKGITLIPALGFQMISEEFPAAWERLTTTRTLGAPWCEMNKLRIFNPDAITETDYTVGQHNAQPVGELCFPPRDEMMLLHYKYLGFERTLQRHKAQSRGLGNVDVSNQWGHQYHWSVARLRTEWDAFKERMVDVDRKDFRPWLVTPPHERWWRPAGFQDSEPGLLNALGLRTQWTPL